MEGLERSYRFKFDDVDWAKIQRRFDLGKITLKQAGDTFSKWKPVFHTPSIILETVPTDAVIPVCVHDMHDVQRYDVIVEMQRRPCTKTRSETGRCFAFVAFLTTAFEIVAMLTDAYDAPIPCCVCGEPTNPHSQACGGCSRRLSFF